MMQTAFAPATPIQVAADETVFLIGRPPMGEYFGFLAQTLEAPTNDQSAIADRWRAANDHVRELEKTERGLADHVEIRELDTNLADLRDRLVADPVVRRAFAFVPIGVAMVELDKLVVFQKHVNLHYVRELQRNLPSDADDADLFRFCLPFDRRYDPPLHPTQIAPNAWAFSSPSADMRVLEVKMLQPDEVPGLVTSGAPTALVAAVIGYGSNYLNAIRVENRLVLNNGSHRAYALREAGYTHAPCLIQNVSRQEELEVITGPDLSQRSELYLTAVRPPMLKDYFDPQLRMLVHVPRKTWMVRVAVQAEGPLPASAA